MVQSNPPPEDQSSSTTPPDLPPSEVKEPSLFSANSIPPPNPLETVEIQVKRNSPPEFLQSIDLQSAIGWITERFQRSGTAFYTTLITIVLSTYLVSDLLALFLGELLPEPPQKYTTGRNSGASPFSRSIQDYQTIFSRNLFNSKGLIPGEQDESARGAGDPGGPVVKSNLPLNLIGTLITEHEAHSIATIEDKAASKIYPVQAGDEIPTKIRITKVESRRATFLNIQANRKEYIEMPDDTPPSLLRTLPVSKPTGGGIEKVSANQFNISRSEVDKALSDMNTILTQARAVPNFENGVAAGYKLFQIVPGSIYDKLGLQNGDVIAALNGQPITDPGKAFEMLSELKTSTHLELQVKKDGKPVNYVYDIH